MTSPKLVTVGQGSVIYKADGYNWHNAALVYSTFIEEPSQCNSMEITSIHVWTHSDRI